MKYCRYIPPPPLSAFISCLWYSHGSQGTHPFERILPNGESGIVFDLRESPISLYDAGGNAAMSFEPAVFCGSRADCFVLDTSQKERVIGIQFRPGGAYPFLGMPASEVAHDNHPLSDLWGREAGYLREQLMASNSTAAMFQILCQALFNRLYRTSPDGTLLAGASSAPHPAVSFAIQRLCQAGFSSSTTGLADSIGLSSRRFIELFRRETGLTAKTFHGVRRFQHALSRLRNRTETNWANLALSCGYYDQPHFNHDFLSFSGVTPGEYLKIATPHLNHLPIG